MLADPALAFEGLLTNDNVALVQYSLTPISQTLANIALGPAIGPIIPPIPLFLQLTASFGITAGLTLGVDTYGFHNAAGQPIDGLFISKASAQLTGSIGLTGKLDLGLAQTGATGSIGLSFGVTGINTGNSAPNDHQVKTVDQNGKAVTDPVLQLDDFTNDVVSGGPFCPFIIGGSANLSLSAFVQVGVSPFDINYTYPLGSVTLFDFTCPSCQPPAPPQLGELFGNLNPKDPPIPGLPVADIEKQLPGTNQVLVLDMGDYASRRQNVNSTGATDEDFEISLPTDQKGINDKALLVERLRGRRGDPRGGHAGHDHRRARGLREDGRDGDRRPGRRRRRSTSSAARTATTSSTSAMAIPTWLGARGIPRKAIRRSSSPPSRRSTHSRGDSARTR